MKIARIALALLILGGLATAPVVAATYGKGVSAAQVVKISELIAHPAAYVGKVVKIEGIVTDVCAKRGCWMTVAGDQEFQQVRFKVEDGVIVIPLDAKGKKAVAEGTFTKIELTKEEALAQAKHMAEENKKPFDPASVTGPMTVYQLNGIGAVID